jgi:ABC-2 type transport system permease protein
VRERLPLAWLALYRRRRMLAALAVGLFAFELLIVVVATTIPTEALFAGKAQIAPPRAFRAFSGSSGDVSIASFPGLLGAGLVHPFWIAMQLTAVCSLAAAAVAADVEAGTIELIAIRPVRRARLLAERAGALLAASVLLNLASALAIGLGVLAVPRLHDAVRLPGVAAAGLLGLGLSVCVAGPVLAVSAAGRHRAQVIGAGVAFGAVGFALNFLAVAWSAVAFLRYLSPFHYYVPADALVAGSVPWGSLAVLVAVGAGGTLLAFRLLARRDLAP